jgi:hypothetical protein
MGVAHLTVVEGIVPVANRITDLVPELSEHQRGVHFPRSIGGI